MRLAIGEWTKTLIDPDFLVFENTYMKISFSVFFILTCHFSYATADQINDYCRKIKIGQAVQIKKEKETLESKGLDVATAVAGENRHNTQMLMISLKGSKEKCDLVIRDGKVAKISQ